MPASKSRIDWALLLLRIAVGGWAILSGLRAMDRADWRPTAAHAASLGLALLKVVCGALTLAGVWMLPACLCLAALASIPVVQGLVRGSAILAQAPSLGQTLTALAAALAGGGRWSLGRG